MIPEYNSEGLLPLGVHNCTWPEFLKRFGTNPHRLTLIGGLKRAVFALRLAGCKRIFVDGSFVTSKVVPKDYDACWDAAYVESKLLDPVLYDFTKGRIAMKTKYLGDWFPSHYMENGSGLTFLDFFQQDKTTGDHKGIVMLETRGVL
jgi:uncharacterized protein DUF6932